MATDTIQALKAQIRIYKQEYRGLRGRFSKDLKLSGKKKDLQQLVAKYKKFSTSIPKVQALIRGVITRHWLTNKVYKSCINETDFFTMDPLPEIPWEEYYCYTDARGLRFGFNIGSLLVLFRKKKGLSIENPYNREEIPLQSLIRFWKINMIMCPTMKKQKDMIGRIREIERLARERRTRDRLFRSANILSEAGAVAVADTPFLEARPDPAEYQIRTMEIIETLNLVESLPLHTRVEELFIQFDYLGNYTQSSWFNNLQPHQVRQFYLRMAEAWSRVNIQQKTLTCMIRNPFSSFMLPNRTFDPDAVRLTCIRIMEYLTYTGFKPTDQQFGVNLILCSLTFVSQDAWSSMRHLW